MTTVAPRSTSSKTAIPRSSTTKVTTLSRTITRTETKTTLTASKTKTKTSKTTSRPGTTKTFTNAKGTTQTTATTTTRLCETPDVEPGHYALQAAINSTDDGGVVCLKEGTFTNALVAYNPPIAHIMKNITIIGAGPGKTIIDGQSKHLGFLIGFGDYTSAIAVTISQLTVQSTRHNIWGNGVMIYGRSGMRVTISDVVFRNCTRTAAIRQASLKNGLPFTRLERVNITGGATASNGFPGAYYGDGETVMVDSWVDGRGLLHARSNFS